VGALRATAGRIDTLHGRDPHDRKKFTQPRAHGAPAVTDWRAGDAAGGASRWRPSCTPAAPTRCASTSRRWAARCWADATYGRSPRDPAVKEIAQALGRHAAARQDPGLPSPGHRPVAAAGVALPADMQRALAALRALPVPAAPRAAGRVERSGRLRRASSWRVGVGASQGPALREDAGEDARGAGGRAAAAAHRVRRFCRRSSSTASRTRDGGCEHGPFASMNLGLSWATSARR
jgi:hypothetical protein